MIPVAISAVMILVVVLCGRERRLRFEERFPPISDAEFVARCSPGVNPDIALRVRRIISENLGVEYDRIHPSARWLEDLGAD